MEENLHNRIVALESLYKELSIKREEILFLNTKAEMEYSEMKDKLNDIHKAIVGNEELGHIGIIKRMSDNEQRIKDLEEFSDKFKLTIAKIGAVGGIIGAGATLIIEWLFKLIK